jgi:hypothetical protein
MLTPEAPLVAGKAPCMYISYIYSKDDVRFPFVKPSCVQYTVCADRKENLQACHPISTVNIGFST